MAEEEIQKVSMSSTKKEILAAYRELLGKYKQRKEQALDAEERIEEIENQKKVALAAELSAENVIKGIGDLKADIGALLGQVSDRLETEVAKFDSIQKAIEVKEKQLKDIYGIEREAGSLATLIEAQRERKEQFESEMAAQRKGLEEEIATARTEWQKEKQGHTGEIAERDAEEATKRQREKEEFQYGLERDRRRAKDQFEEEKARMEREIERHRKELEMIVSRKQEIEQLRQQVENFPQEKEEAAAKAKEEGADRVRAEAKSREEFQQKEFDGERQVLQTRIESLEKTIQEQNQHIARLSQSQDKAYQQVQDIAVKAVEGASNVKSMAASLQAAPTGEQQKRRSHED